MKDFLTTEYIFLPGISGSGYVEFINLDDFDITRLVSIINQTRGVVIYATGSVEKAYSSISGKRVFLNFDTSTHNAGDKLQIIYKSSRPLKTTDIEQQDLIRLLNRLVKIMENQQACDAAQRQRVTIDAGILPTVTTVSSVTAIANALPAGTNIIGSIAQMAGMNQEQYINIARNAYANSIRSKLEFS
jgi:hypothetical protein